MKALLASVALALLALGGRFPALAQAPAGLGTARMNASGKVHFLQAAALPELICLQPAPPAADSLAAQADLEAVLQVQTWRTPEQVAFAKKIDEGSVFDFAEVLGPWFTADRLPLLKQLFKQIDADAGTTCGQAKRHFARLRPPYLDPRIQPCIETPSRSSFSYPSGHSTRLYVEALVLGLLFPDRQQELLTWAHKAAWGRIIAGVHFPSDDMGGRILAEALFVVFKGNPELLSAIEKGRAEAAPLLLKKAG